MKQYIRAYKYNETVNFFAVLRPLHIQRVYVCLRLSRDARRARRRT